MGSLLPDLNKGIIFEVFICYGNLHVVNDEEKILLKGIQILEEIFFTKFDDKLFISRENPSFRLSIASDNSVWFMGR